MMNRRDFIGSVGAAGAVVGTEKPSLSSDPTGWRRHFPALRQRINGHPLTYLDTAATSLRPQPVLDAMMAFYCGPNANPGATLHTLARRAAEAYDAARREIAGLVGSSDPLEIVFTRGTTEAINLAAFAWGMEHLKGGDEILLTEAEHASNMLPWQLVAARTGARVRYDSVHDDGQVDLESFSKSLSSRTRIAAFSHVSNVVGLINPVREMCDRARAAGAVTLVDAAQSAPHFPIDVREIGCDFLALSSHKMCGPMGVGALWARRELLEAITPYQAGSNMAHDVDLDSRHYSEGALKFGAGTPNVADAIGFAAAARYLREIGWDALRRHERLITRRMLDGLARVRGLHLLGASDAAARIGVFAFTIDGRKPAEIVTALDAKGIALRAGDLAALPLLKRLGVTSAARASCYLYTTPAEIDRLLNALQQ